MTGTEIFKIAMSLMMDDAEEDYKPFALTLLNVLLIETFDVNNGLRSWNGLEHLPQVPSMSDLDGVCPYEAQLTGAALPFGLAAKLIFDDGDMNKMATLYNQYVALVNDARKAETGVMLDVYGENDDE